MLTNKLFQSVVVGCCVVLTGVAADCRAQEPSPANLPGAENPLAVEYRSVDTNGDGLLVIDEYLKRAERDAKLLKRDFIVFDSNNDKRLSFEEFVTIPVGQSEDQRGTIFDPVIQLCERLLESVTAAWKKADKNSDDLLDLQEFSDASITQRIPGLESTSFGDWDLNHDNQLSRDEARRVLEIACGVRAPRGDLLRTNTGRVVDWALFSRLKTDEKGMISKDEYFRALGPIPDQEKWLASTDKNGDGQFDFAEYALSNHRTDPVGTFLDLDTDFNGRLSIEELDALQDGWRYMAIDGFQGFDDDHDGRLTLQEFQLMPHCNILASWQAAVDTNNDGVLTIEEFRFNSGIPLNALCAEYFKRLDSNQDKVLSLDEYAFVTKNLTVQQNEIRVLYSDGSTLIISIPDYPLIYSPEISPDGKWVAVDGWKHGQNNVAAHLLFASTESDEVRDLGIGCIPHWCSDGHKIGYSKYAGGVFIRDFEGKPEDEESINPRGWSIHFARDGQKAAYVINGRNLMVHDLQSGVRKMIFPEGKSPYNHIEHNFSWSPDSNRICFKGQKADGALEVGIVSTAGKDPNLKVRCDGQEVQSDFAWHVDGKRLFFPRAVPGRKTQLYELDPDSDTPAVRYPRQPLNRNNMGISWSRDGKTLVYLSTR